MSRQIDLQSVAAVLYDYWPDEYNRVAGAKKRSFTTNRATTLSKPMSIFLTRTSPRRAEKIEPMNCFPP